MATKNGKAKSPKPKAVVPIERAAVRLLKQEAEEFGRIKMWVARVDGILNGVEPSPSLDSIRHRVRSLLGHRRHAKAVGDLLLAMMTRLSDLDTRLG